MAKVAKPPAAPTGQKGGQARPAPRPAAPAHRQPAGPPAASRLGRLGSLGSRSIQQAPTTTFFREAFSELKKVHWPTREQTTQMTVIVIVVSLATGGILGGLDFGFAQLIRVLVGAQ